MQIHLTLEELEALKRLDEEQRWLSCDAQPPITQLSAPLYLQDEWKIGRDLVGQGLSRNLLLGFDGLENLARALSSRKDELLKQIGRTADASAKSVLERRLSILDHLLEKVTEACAMI